MKNMKKLDYILNYGHLKLASKKDAKLFLDNYAQKEKVGIQRTCLIYEFKTDSKESIIFKSLNSKGAVEFIYNIYKNKEIESNISRFKASK